MTDIIEKNSDRIPNHNLVIDALSELNRMSYDLKLSIEVISRAVGCEINEKEDSLNKAVESESIFERYATVIRNTTANVRDSLAMVAQCHNQLGIAEVCKKDARPTALG